MCATAWQFCELGKPYAVLWILCFEVLVQLLEVAQNEAFMNMYSSMIRLHRLFYQAYTCCVHHSHKILQLQ